MATDGVQIPFVRMTPKKIDPQAFRFADKLRLIALTQDINGPSDPHTESGYKTEKINVFDFNGSKSQNQDLWTHVDARVKNKTRRLQLMLIEQDTLHNLCPNQERDPKSNVVALDPLNYSDLEKYCETKYEITISELSLICRENINAEVGHRTMMENTGAEKYGYEFNAQIFGDSKGLEFVKNHIWEDSEEVAMKMSLKKNVGAKGAIKRKEAPIQKKNHDFRRHYFKALTFCSVCNEFIWGIAQKQGYKCMRCSKAVHDCCINRVQVNCGGINMVYQPTSDGDSGLQIKQDIKHNCAEVRNWSLGRHCKQSGKMILPLTKMAKCQTCRKPYHMSVKDRLPTDCGTDEIAIYHALGAVQGMKKKRIQGQAITNETVDINLVYGKIPIKVNPENVAKGQLDGCNDTMLKQIGANELIPGASVRRRKTVKKLAESGYNSFTIHSVLGQGSFGKVLLATYKTNASKNKFVAIKAIRKDITVEGFDVPAVHLEKDCLALKSDFLIQAICTFQDPKYLYFCMEFYAGGDVMSHIINNQQNGVKMKLDDTKIMGFEVLLGLKYMHLNGYVFRDLKLDNIMIDNDGHCRIADFGMVKAGVDMKNDRTYCTTFCGTPDYMAPEILHKQKYAFPVDVWAWGVCFFEMVEGFSPFQGKTEDDLFKQIKYKPPPGMQHAKTLDKGAKHLLQKVLVKEPSKRATIEDCLEHVVFKSINRVEVESRRFRPGVSPTNCKDMSSFMSNFSEDFTELSTNLDEGEFDIRALQEDEDRAFQEFNWFDKEKVAHFQR